MLYKKGVYLLNGKELVEDFREVSAYIVLRTGILADKHIAKRGTLSYKWYKACCSSSWERLEIVAVYLDGNYTNTIGPQDVAGVIFSELMKKEYSKNMMLEFIGPGVASLNADFRTAIDVIFRDRMGIQGVWLDQKDSDSMQSCDVAYYDKCVKINLNAIKAIHILPLKKVM